MPYNNAPITPSDEVTGSSALPLARVKKIIAQDDEIAQCSNSAAFAISVATEIFVRYLTEQAHTVVKSERKPRRNIAYKDIAMAVSRIDNLEFLVDVVPRTKTFRQVKEDEAMLEAAAAARTKPLGLNGGPGDAGPKPIIQMMQQGYSGIDAHATHGPDPRTEVPQDASMPQSTLVQRTILQNGYEHGHPPQPGDVNMTG